MIAHQQMKLVREIPRVLSTHMQIDITAAIPLLLQEMSPFGEPVLCRRSVLFRSSFLSTRSTQCGPVTDTRKIPSPSEHAVVEKRAAVTGAQRNEGTCVSWTGRKPLQSGCCSKCRQGAALAPPTFPRTEVWWGCRFPFLPTPGKETCYSSCRLGNFG